MAKRFRSAAVLFAIALLGAMIAPAAAVAAGEPVTLQFAVQPGDGAAGAPLSRQPVVRVVDVNGNTVSSSTAVLLTGSHDQDVFGCLENPVRAIKGIATFHGCTMFSGPIAGSRIRATAYRVDAAIVEPAWSFLIDVWPPGSPRGPNFLAFDVALPGSTWGGTLQAQLHLRPTADGQDVTGRRIHIQLTDDPYDPASWRTLGDVTTDATGSASFTGYRPVSNHVYRAILDGTPDLRPAISQALRVVVRHRLVVRPTTQGHPRVLTPGTTITFRAIVRPARPETTTARVTWEILRLVDGRWTTSIESSVADMDGIASLTWTFTTGRWIIRARTLPTATNANSAPTYDAYIVR